MIKELTGWHVLGAFIVGFGIIITVNLTLAYNAVSTFPGLETKNSYISSQQFEGKRQAQEALGWVITPTYADGQVRLSIRDAYGRAVQPVSLDVVIGRPTHVADDVAPTLAFDGAAHVADTTLAPGAWLVRIEAEAYDGTPFAQRVPLYVKSGA